MNGRFAGIAFCVIAAALFVGSGLTHLVRPAFYERIVPPGFGPPSLVVFVSGVAEIVGGIGLLITPLRRAAGWGLIALLIAVFPANLYMAIHAEKFSDLNLPAWALWARLPLQPIFIVGVWWCAVRRREQRV